MNKAYIYITAVLACCCMLTGAGTVSAESHKDSVSIAELYETLDKAIAGRDKFVAEKELRINLIKEELNAKNITPELRHSINERLYDEYSAFKYDSAYKYIYLNVVPLGGASYNKEQYTIGDSNRLYRCRLKLAHIYSVSGMFDKARCVLEEINTDSLNHDNLMDYYKAYSEYYLYMTENSYSDDYLDNMMAYRCKLIGLAPADSYTYVFSYATYIFEKGNSSEAIRLLEEFLPRTKEREREFSILANTLAFFYSREKRRDKQEYYLLRAAISDVCGAIREENSLRELAMLLMEKGETDRAFRYLRINIEDATFYGTMLRSQQAAALVPEIVTAYENERDKVLLTRTILLVIISVVALLLVISRIYRSRIIRRLEEANGKINSINGELNATVSQLNITNGIIKESNRIKDEYIGRFLELCSRLIALSDEQRKKENRLARDRKLTELYDELKSNKYINDTTRLFYQNFDTAFLNIYPNFPQAVNDLLEEQQRIELKGEKLTTELRILALIRLGITDNQKIADILRSSITTIYTYRSKIKARAVSKETFEEDIKRISAY